MKILRLLPLVLIVALCSCNSETKETRTKTPLQKPESYQDEYGPDKELEKELFFEQIYFAEEGTNIDSIRFQNWKKYYETYQLIGTSSQKTTEIFANGYITATWHERGPDNEAGDMREVDFHAPTEEIYGLSSVGHLLKGNLDGSGWTFLRDDIRFENEVLEVVPHNGGLRIFAAYGEDVKNKIVRYSDDDGQNWTMGTGFVFYDHWGRARRLYTLSDDYVLYYLVHTWSANPWGEIIQLYKSIDKGATYTKIWDSPVGYKYEDVDLWKPFDSDSMFLIDNNAKTYTVLTHAPGSGNTIFSNPVSYASQNIPDGSIHVSGRFNNQVNGYELFIFHENSEDVYSTTDGANWTFLSNVGNNIFRKAWLADPNNPNLYMGGFQLNKSKNLTNWSEQYAQWWEYYGTSKDSMHVDIMNLDYFEKLDGTPFILISNHAGLHVTYNSFHTTSNLGLDSLNVVTLYDQSTSSDGFLYCGAQDKGTFVYNGDSKSDFDRLNTQNETTGDGMLGVFFNNEISLFGMLQNGYLFCMPDKTVSFYDAYGRIPGNHTSGWINPMVSTVDPADNKVYVAGGNLNGGDGCYLIEMDVDLSFGVTWLTSQFNYDFRANSNDSASVIKALGVAESDPDRIYVATQDATFFYSEDRGNSWTKSSAILSSSLIPWEIISSKTDADKVFISGTGFTNPGVYQSNDGGISFASLSNDIPEATFYEIALSDDEDYLFAATSEGPFVYVFADSKWYSLVGTGTPYVNFTSVDNIGDYVIRFGTYGRGVWDFEIEKPAVGIEDETHNNLSLTLYPNPASEDLIIEFDSETNTLVQIEIIDLSGRVVLRSSHNSNSGTQQVEVNVSELTAGIYIAQISVGSEFKSVSRFQKL